MHSEDSDTKDKIAQHLEELMRQSDLYVWEKVQAYHGVWLNQIEQDRLYWNDSEEKLKFC